MVAYKSAGKTKGIKIIPSNYPSTRFLPRRMERWISLSIA
jgi:hypothetical protein